MIRDQHRFVTATRRVITGLAVGLAAVTLVACSGIPRSGVVHQGESLTNPASTAIEFLPASPSVGATQEQILRGFLDAASSPQNDFAIAREFLADGFRTSWDASASVTVDLGSRAVSSAAENVATLETVTSATVDSRGIFAEANPATPLSLQYQFVQENGQWRLSTAPEGVVIDRFTFDQVFSTHALYFFDPTFTHLVPDVRWFPAGTSTTTRIMKALLAGPAAWLAEGGGVVSAFPAETALVADAVPIAGRTALVDLTAQALGATREGLQHMQRQAAESLTSVDTVSTVQLLVDGNLQDIAVPADTGLASSPRVDGRPLILMGGRFGFLNGDSVTPVVGLSTLIEELKPRALAVSSSLTLATALTDTGVVLVRATTGTTDLDSRPNLITPALDGSNYVWSVPVDSPTAVFVYSTDGVGTPVATPWSEASRIVSLNIARDGTRLIALLDVGGEAKFVAANIQRGDRNRPITIGTPVTLAASNGIPVDAAWADPSTVVALITGAEGSSQITSQTIGGQSEILPSSSAGVAVVGANVLTQLRLRTVDNRLFALRGTSYWQLVASDVSLLATVQ